MKTITGLFVGAAMLVSGAASAQYYAETSISGRVLSYGSQGFVLQGPDGNYGIAVTPATVFDNSWGAVVTGPGSVQPGEYVTATGYPTSQWVMQATQVVAENWNTPTYPGYGYNGYPGSAAYPGYGSYYGYPGGGIIVTPNVYSGYPQGNLYRAPLVYSSPPNALPNYSYNPSGIGVIRP